MACFKPAKGYAKNPEKNGGKGGWTPSPRLGFIDKPLTIPCGSCMGCRLDHARQWAIRCMHEAKFHDDSIFVTLTYDDDNLPYRASLVRRDLQLFHKRLYKKIGKFRFFYCGEYGDQLERPHFHDLIFGWFPSDASPSGKSKSGDILYESKILSKIWGLGHVNFGRISYESAAYVARYSTKKITGLGAADHYERHDPDTGEIYTLTQEFIGMSLKPGIGFEWFERYGVDSFKKDEIIINGHPMKPPRAYDKWLQRDHPKLYNTVKAARYKAMAERPDDPRQDTYNLYNAKNTIALAKAKPRNLK